MGQKLHNRIEIWKKLLLDFGKRNRLINFLEGKRNNVKITTPSFDRLWELVVVNEREVVFPYAKKVQVDDDGEEIYEAVIKGDIETSKPIPPSPTMIPPKKAAMQNTKKSFFVIFSNLIIILVFYHFF